MTLEQLRIFVAVAYVEHFTRAAQRLRLSQSAVSAAIAALEAEHRVLLFDRARRHVELTAVGSVFLEEAEAILARVDLAIRRLHDLSELRIGHLAIAASQTVANYWLPLFLNAYHERYPGITIDLWHGNSTQVERRVLRGQAEFGIIEQDPHDTTLATEVLAPDELVAVVGQNHPWFGRESVEWLELTQTAWIMREPGSGTRALFESALIHRGIEPDSLDVSLVLKTGEAVRNAVTVGNAAAVLSTLVADDAFKANTLHRLKPISITRHFVFLKLPGRKPTNAATAMIDFLRAANQSILVNDLGRSGTRSIGKIDALNLLSE
jgi:DNA-binding transcriptional LysR family regulator